MYRFSDDFDKPHALIVCAHCFEVSRYDAAYFDALNALDITLTDVHPHMPIEDECRQRNELICIDVYNLPTTELRMPLDRLKSWGKRMAEVEENFEDAFFAWAESDIVVYDDNDLPDYNAFKKAFIDVYYSFQEFTDRLADEALETLPLEGLPFEDIRYYFNYDRFCEDQTRHYVELYLPSGLVAVFK